MKVWREEKRELGDRWEPAAPLWWLWQKCDVSHWEELPRPPARTPASQTPCVNAVMTTTGMICWIKMVSVLWEILTDSIHILAPLHPAGLLQSSLLPSPPILLGTDLLMPILPASKGKQQQRNLTTESNTRITNPIFMKMCSKLP